MLFHATLIIHKTRHTQKKEAWINVESGTEQVLFD
jgi:hypothetical protein